MYVGRSTHLIFEVVHCGFNEHMVVGIGVPKIPVL